MSVETAVIEVVMQWLRGQVSPALQGRRNFRLVCVDPSYKAALQERLDAEPHGGVRWFVRSSADEDAVELRHGDHPSVPADGGLVYVLLWSEGSSDSDRNAQSLVDVRPYDVADLLAAPTTFQLRLEGEVGDRLAEAAAGWPPAQQDAARRHLVAAWRAITTALRLAPHKMEHPFRLVESLERYVGYLSACTVPAREWDEWPPDERAARLFRRVGDALSHLDLFRVPAVAQVLRMQLAANLAPPTAAEAGEALWATEVESLLLKNSTWASDYGGLADAIAGKRTVAEQLSSLLKSGDIRLAQDRADEAVEALLRYCNDGDVAARSVVEWVFYDDGARGARKAFGLHGLLNARGRKAPRVDPIEKLVFETVARLGVGLAEPALAALRTLLTAEASSPAGRQRIAAALRHLGGDESIDVQGDWRALVDQIRALPGHAPDVSQALAAQWDALDPKRKADEVVASSVLLGVARLLHSAVHEESRGKVDALVLAVSDAPAGRGPTKSFVVDDTLPAQLSDWLRRDVRDYWAKDEADDEDVDDDGEESLSFTVVRAGRTKSTLGTIRLAWRVGERRWRREATTNLLATRRLDLAGGVSARHGRALLKDLYGTYPTGVGGLASLDASWSAAAQEIGVGPSGTLAEGAEVIDLVAPVGRASRDWVAAWAKQVALGCEDGPTARRRELEEQRAKAIDEDDYALAKSLKADIAALGPAGVGSTLSIDQLRRVLRTHVGEVNDASGHPVRLALGPHHPLVVRLRGLADDLLGAIVVQLWAGSWPAEAKEELSDALGNWGLPEPQHAYGTCGSAPLVFDGWADGHAMFVPLGSNRETDGATIGVKATREVVERFAELFPNAADRVALRIRGDEAGSWAWATVGRWIAENAKNRAGGPSRADISVVTGLPSRDITRFESEALASGDALASLEPGPNGVVPAVRFRRTPPRSNMTARAHISLVVADRLAAFQPRWTADSHAHGSMGIWDSRRMFAEPRANVADYTHRVGEVSDHLSTVTAAAVGRACGTGNAMAETYNFDPETCRPSLQGEQSSADWLVLVSRQPAHRAVQACGNISTLLDFRTRYEGGRPVHICVSLGEDRRTEASAALGRACAGLLGVGVVDPERLLKEARSLAPGKALRALGTSSTDLLGLFGLLLTANSLRRPGRLVMSLDQHSYVLARGGQLADLFTLELAGDGVTLGVAEAKFSLNAHSLGAEPIPSARRQVESTRRRLARFTVEHPLSGRSRAILARAAIHQIHLLDRVLTPAEVAPLYAVAEAVANPGTPIAVAPSAACAVHAWSWESGARDGTDANEGVQVEMHGGGATAAALGDLLGRGGR